MRIAYLPGDGVGPEVLSVARNVLSAAGFEAEWVELPIGWTQWCAWGNALPSETLKALATTQAALFGAITSKPDPEAEAELVPSLRGKGLRYRSPILRLRKELELSVNVRRVQSYEGNPHALRPDVDLVIFRENTEGLYAGFEAHPFPESLRQAWAQAVPDREPPAAGPDTAVSLRVVTRRATEHVVKTAFESAQKEGRRKVTLVEKPNVLRATGGLVRSVFQEISHQYPEIETEELNVDAACAALVRQPDAFDILVATNLFGDILSDVAAEVAGGLPLAAAGNVGERYAIFEPVHGSAPTLAGTNLANPIGAVLAGAMLARHVGQTEVAERVERAVRELVAQGATLPQDLGGHAATSEIEEALLRQVGHLLNV